MMRLTVLALALLGGASAKLFTLDRAQNEANWIEFKRTFGKSYATEAEEQLRREIFVSNLALIDERNVKEALAGGSAVHGITKFMDLAPEEFAARYLTAKKTSRSNAERAPRLPTIGSVSKDWTGVYTTDVKNQGYCGSCWAFSATEQIESDAMRTLGSTYVLSPAQIAQCDKTAFGCDGGWTEHAYNYVQRAGGVELDSDYPYPSSMSKLGQTGTCSSDSSKYKVTVTNYYTVSSESQMASYVGSTGPLSVCLDASTWNSYTSGIMSSCGTSVDHCVQAVGVDTSSSNGYWKVRNSWGSDWGEDGFIRLAYGANTCDITNDPTYVAVALA